MAKTNYTFVRNEHYTTAQVGKVYGHNERKNENPLNGDIVAERQNLNVHFRQNLREDGTPETYNETINRLLENRTIVKYNFKPKSALIDELVFDVNTEFFDERGGYDYAVQFFTEAYRCAVKEVGGEQYILSAVLHADERNKGLSEQLGRDVYHYHLHVVYVPVVTKEIKYTKRAGAELAGKVKEVITQINHTDKWPRIKVGRGYINEYSKLQDRFYEHMRSAGFDGFERGERGSSAEHLDVLDYKIQQDNKRLDVLDERVEKREAKLERLDEKIMVKEKAKATIAEVDAMGKPTLLGNGFTVTNDEMKKLKSLAKKSVTLDDRITATKKKMAAVEDELATVKRQLDEAKQEAHHWYQELTYLKNEVKDYLRLAAKFPARVKEFFSGLFREEQEQEKQQREAERQTQLAERQQRKKTYEIGR